MNHPRLQRGITITLSVLLIAVVVSTGFAGNAAALWFFDGNQDSACAPSSGVDYYPKYYSASSSEISVGIENKGSNDGEQAIQAFDGDGNVIGTAEDVSIPAGGTRTVTITHTRENLGAITIMTPNNQWGDTVSNDGCYIRDTDEDDDDENAEWTLPDRAADSDITASEYADLWYGVTTYEEGSEQYNVLEASLDDELEESLGSQYVFSARNTSAKAFTTQYKPHTYQWNSELESQDVRSDVITYIKPNKQVSNARISDVGIEILSIDPHAEYLTNPRNNPVYSVNQRIKYINSAPETTVAVSDYSASARADTEDETEPYTYKTDYSISNREVTRKLEIKDRAGTVIASSDITEGIEKEDLDIKDETKAGDRLTFEVTYSVTVTEKEEEYSRGYSTYTIGEPPDTSTGYDYDPWELDDTTYHEYSVSTSDTMQAVMYRPELDVEYTTLESDRPSQQETKVLMTVENTNSQPISGFSPTLNSENAFNEENPTQTVQYPTSFYSVSHPEYRSTFASADVLPVSHVAMPSSNEFTTRGYAKNNVQILSSDGITSSYPNPDEVTLPIDAITVLEPNSVTVYGSYPQSEFDISTFEAEPIVPDTPVEGEIAVAEIDREIKQINIEIASRKIANNEYSVAIRTTDETGARIGTEQYDTVQMTAQLPGQNSQTFDTSGNGQKTFTIETAPPEAIHAGVETEIEQSNEPVFVGSSESYIIGTEGVDAEGAVTNILLAIVNYSIWYFLSPVIMLALITKGLTGEWNPFFDFLN